MFFKKDDKKIEDMIPTIEAEIEIAQKSYNDCSLPRRNIESDIISTKSQIENLQEEKKNVYCKSSKVQTDTI